MTPDTPTLDDPRSIRLAHLRAESGIKSIGQLCYLVTFLSGLGMLEFILVAVGVLPYDPVLHEVATPTMIRGFFWVLTGFLLLNLAANGALGHGLTRLQSWARWTVVVLTGLSLISWIGFSVGVCFVHLVWGLLSLLIGGALHVVILYPMLTRDAGVVFSRQYKEAIRATPDLRSRMHWLLKMCLGLILAGVVGLIGYLSAIYLRIID